MFIRSERLFLRPAWPEDRAEIQQVLGEDAPYGDASPRHPQFVITLPDYRGAQIVGLIGFAQSVAGTELYVSIGCDWRGRGFATEAVRAALTLARTLGHCRVLATSPADCVASARVMTRLGFVRHGAVLSGPARDVYVRDLCSATSDPADPAVLQRAA